MYSERHSAPYSGGVNTMFTAVIFSRVTVIPGADGLPTEKYVKRSDTVDVSIY